MFVNLANVIINYRYFNLFSDELTVKERNARKNVPREQDCFIEESLNQKYIIFVVSKILLIS